MAERNKTVKPINVKTIVMVVATLFILLIGIYFINTYEQKNKSSQQALNSLQNTKPEEFRSKRMKLTISLPNTIINIKEGQTFLDINFKDGVIEIVKNGTNYDSLDAYLNQFRKDIYIEKSANLRIDGYSASSRIELLPDKSKQKIYYLLVNNWVYAISSKSESLFPELDQIAQSFRYAP